MITAVMKCGGGEGVSGLFLSSYPSRGNPRTNLVKTTLVRENGDMSIVCCLDEAWSVVDNEVMGYRAQLSEDQSTNIPDMMAVI